MVDYRQKNLETSVRYLKGIGPKRAENFAKSGIYTIEDLLYFFPRRYEDRTNISLIKDLKEGELATIKAKVLVKGSRQSFRNRRFNIFEMAVSDDTGKISCVWFNQPYLKDYFQVDQDIILHGKVEHYGQRLQISNPEFEVVSGGGEEILNAGRIVPVYSLPPGLSQRTFRKFIKQVLDEFLPKLNDFLPFNIRAKNNLFNLAKSLLEIHFPTKLDLQKEAFRRLSFEEFFLFESLLSLRKAAKSSKQGIAHNTQGNLPKEFIVNLPFKLTASQKKVIIEIAGDMARPQVMQRLLQGDVGSGKTVVAAIAGLMAIQGGYQVAFMAPTEILAKQHYEKIKSQSFDRLRIGPERSRMGQITNLEQIEICLLTSSIDKKEKEKIQQRIQEGRVDLVIGTHALLQGAVQFKKLGLVVIDEQHKFGVGQRALLGQKGISPDVLIMTATPIPRTLAITLYGDLDISIINELPPGRLPVKTFSFTLDERKKAYVLAKKQLDAGHQVFVVYPVIEESYALDMEGAKKMFDKLKAGEFKNYRVGLIHGKLKQPEQDRVMLKFKNKELDLLVSTTVLEVGIDIPEATCMIVEHAQRFGLSQLHQLRGRVGRGSAESFCYLISDSQTEEAKARVVAMVNYNDGFRIAEEDLKIRGPGEFFGSRQHGLTELRIANPLTQMQLLKKARDEAIKLIQLDPRLELRQNLALKQKLIQRFPEYEKLMITA